MTKMKQKKIYENDVISNGILIIPIGYENWKQAEINK